MLRDQEVSASNSRHRRVTSARRSLLFGFYKPALALDSPHSSKEGMSSEMASRAAFSGVASRTASSVRGGGGGIRTHETLSGLTVFKTAGVNRFPTPPFLTGLLWRIPGIYALISSFFFSFDFPTLAHRASTALRAISLRCSAVSFAARILPPLEPPIFPKATACAFFFLAIDRR